MADWVSLFPLIFSRAKIALALARVQERIYEFFEVGGGVSGKVGIFILTSHTNLGRGLYPPPPPIRHWTEWASAN